MPRTEALLVITAAYTGMRWGELAGLHRDNVVLDPPGSRVVPHLRVDPDLGALHEVAGRLWLGPPKTESSERIVVLPRFLTHLLAEHLAEHPYPFVFTGRDGGHVRRGSFRARVWLPALAGDPDHPDPSRRNPVCAGMAFHRLRHAHKTWMIEDGIPEIAQYARLGHRMPGVAARYAHPTYVMWHRLLQALQHRWQHEASTASTHEPIQPGELTRDARFAAA
jgi:integrase